MTTVPNQKVIHINKELKGSFVQLVIDDMAEAAQVLSPSAFKLYLYLAGNKTGYNLALSPQDFEAVYGVKVGTYRKAVTELAEKGYLINRCGNIWDFYTKRRA